MNRRKKQYRGNNFIASERAVALSLGFILLAGICITAFCRVISASLPFWTKTFEAAHASAVADEFCDLATEINGTIAVAKEGGQNAAGTSVIKMKPDRVPIIGISPPGSCLEVRPDIEQLNITPYVGASHTNTVYNFSWIENTTANFSNFTSKANVDTNFDMIKLSRVDIADNLTITNTTTALTGVYYYDTVEIRNSTVYLIPNRYLKLYANTIYIDAASRIIADECGYLGGDGGNLGAGPGFGRYGYNGSGGGGAGHNGTGGKGGLRDDAISGDEGAGGFSYGDNTSISFVLGSGGAGGGCGEGTHGVSHQGEPGGYGGNGGGAVLLNAQQINVHGNISVNGAAGSDGFGADLSSGGGGSGGTLIIQGDEVNLSSATLSANGGSGGSGGIGLGDGGGGGGGGGGAGGRIKIFYNASLYDNSPPTHHEVKGIGGAGGGAKGGQQGDSGLNGTAGIFYKNETTYDSEAFYEDSGYYVSRVFDTGNTTTCYGNISWYGNTTDYTSIVVKVRTSIHEEIDDVNATLWANCDAAANGQNLTDLTSVFDCQQYIQYRVELSTFDTTQTPVFTGIRINYFSSDPAGGFPVVAEASGAIKFTNGHIYYPKHELTYEHGAVIKSQHVDGDQQGLFIQPPPIRITNLTGIPTINISMIDLSGSSDSYSGTATASLENAYKTHDSFSTKFNNLTLNLSTEYPAIWGKWFNDTLKESDLTPNYYNVTVNETYVATEFYGHGAGVQLNVDKAVVAVSL